MARKVITVVIDGDKRDAGKVFELTEMPAVQGEKWGTRALLALSRGGVEIPDNLAALGLAGLAVMGVEALGRLQWEAAEPLLDEMFDCVKIVPDVAHPAVTRRIVESDIEEIATLIKLRKEILALHIDFFTDATLLTQARAAAKALQT
jgi:hypothetical protein